MTATGNGETDQKLIQSDFHSPDAKTFSDVLTPVCSFNIVSINVSGLRFQTFLETLERYPDTLLGDPVKRAPYYNPSTGEYFFDRHRHCFEALLYYYQSSGKLKRPENVSVDIFLKELKFFEMGDAVIEKFWALEGYKKPKETVLPKNKFQRQVFQLIEHADTSIYARIVAIISVFVIVLSTLSFCLETIPELSPKKAEKMEKLNDTVNATSSGNTTLVEVKHSEWDNPFYIIECICIVWFTIEFILRFASCPSKCEFVQSFMNWVDFVAIVPFFINSFIGSGTSEGSTGSSFAILRVIRLVRVFRIFKLSRHSHGLQILGMTFKASIQELGLLVFFLMIGLILFSSAIYFAEAGQPGTTFHSIPAGFWYAVVTMTTVGYGDMTPVGPWGKLVGSMCAIAGVLVLALPVPVIVANFKHFYRQETRLAHMRAIEDGDDFDDAASASS